MFVLLPSDASAQFGNLEIDAPMVQDRVGGVDASSSDSRTGTDLARDTSGAGGSAYVPSLARVGSGASHGELMVRLASGTSGSSSSSSSSLAGVWWLCFFHCLLWFGYRSTC